MIDLTDLTGGVSDYTELTNQPQINGVTLTGNKTSEDLNIYLPDGYTINVATDGSGDFTSIQDALNSLESKICAGIVYVKLKAGTYNVSGSIQINETFNHIPNLIISGAGVSNTIVSFTNVADWTGAFNFGNAKTFIKFTGFTLLNASASKANENGIRLQNSYLTLTNMKFQNWTHAINSLTGSYATVKNNTTCTFIDCTYCLEAESGNIDVGFDTKLNVTNATTVLYILGGGVITVYSVIKSFTNVTNETNNTFYTINSNGLIKGAFKAS